MGTEALTQPESSVGLQPALVSFSFHFSACNLLSVTFCNFLLLSCSLLCVCIFLFLFINFGLVKILTTYKMEMVVDAGGGLQEDGSGDIYLWRI